MNEEAYREALRRLAARQDWEGVERLVARYGRALLRARLRSGVAWIVARLRRRRRGQA
jgi:hypothetical protein